MIALRHLCKNVTLAGSFLASTRSFSISRLGTKKWAKQIENGRRWMSVQREATEDQDRSVTDIEHIGTDDTESRTPAAAQEHPVDWFENRYPNKEFHARDGLDPDEWLLLYRITDEEYRNRIEYSLYAIALGALACGAYIFVVTCIRRDDNPFGIAPAFFLIGFFCVTYAMRLRRYGVVRLYSRRYEQEEWERWRFDQLRLPPGERDIKAPTRRFRIIWTDIAHRPHMFAYNSHQVSDGIYRKKWLSRAMNGNFLVLGRPWALHPEFFEESPDYIFVRRQ